MKRSGHGLSLDTVAPYRFTHDRAFGIRIWLIAVKQCVNEIAMMLNSQCCRLINQIL